MPIWKDDKGREQKMKQETVANKRIQVIFFFFFHSNNAGRLINSKFLWRAINTYLHKCTSSKSNFNHTNAIWTQQIMQLWEEDILFHGQYLWEWNTYGLSSPPSSWAHEYQKFQRTVRSPFHSRYTKQEVVLSLSRPKSPLDSEVLPAGSHKIKSQKIKTERLKEVKKKKNQWNSIK